ncbi:MAG: 50S ribosomal protein L11 methyltransferase [Rickettsiella sp.]|nr:50S ribosomal protein L11 methyltransferase [Rickettsiella sp.]
MAWLELTIQTKEIYTACISDFLEQTHAASITWQAADAQALFEPDLDTTPLWRYVNIRALYAEETPITDLVNTLHTKFGKKAILDCCFKSVADKDWERVWLNDFQPMCFGKRLWVYPSAYEPPDSTGIIIRLDPGLAFGTGTHPTTALCLEWIDAHLQPNQTVIDYGCGSGILAIAALKCGAKHVFAIDHDPQAIEATQANVRQNTLAPERIHCGLSSQFKLDVKVDVIFANILAKPLMDLAATFKHLIKKNGQCVLSGIFSEQVASVQQRYIEQGFMLTDIQYKQEWVIMVVCLSS